MIQQGPDIMTVPAFGLAVAANQIELHPFPLNRKATLVHPAAVDFAASVPI
jgi:hypothetical protein